MEKRAIIILAIALIAVIVIAGVVYYFYYYEPTPSPEIDEIRIGTSLSLTGVYTAVAYQCEQAYKMAIEEINENGGIYVEDLKRSLPLRLIMYDDEYDPARTASNYEKLVTEDKIHFALGPSGSTPTTAGSTVTEKYEIPMLEGAGLSNSVCERGYDYIYMVVTRSSWLRLSARDLFLQLNETYPGELTTVAFSVENVVGSVRAYEAAAEQILEAGFVEVFNEKYEQSPTDLTPHILKAKEADPDIFMSFGHYEDTVLAIRNSKEVGFEPKIFNMQVGPAMPEWKDSLGDDGAYITGYSCFEPAISDAAKALHDKFLARTGVFITYHGAASYSCVYVLKDAIERAGTLDPQKVKQALDTTDMDTAFGMVQFDEFGMNLKASAAVLQWQYIDGELQKVIVYPEAWAEEDVVFPFPSWTER